MIKLTTFFCAMNTNVCTFVFMASDTTFTFRISKQLRDQAIITANALGIPLSTIIHAFLIELVAGGKVEFRVPNQKSPQMKREGRQVDKLIPKSVPDLPPGPVTTKQAEA